MYWIPAETGPQLSDPYKTVLEPTRVLTAEEVAAVVTQRGAYTEADR